MLPFDALFVYLDHFFAEGIRFSFKFGLALLNKKRNEIANAKQQNVIYEILRLEGHTADALAIIHDAQSISIGDLDLAEQRKHMYDSKLRARMERVVEKLDSDDEISSFDSDDSGEGSVCNICDNNAPEVVCYECKKLVCELCHEKSKGGHSNKHKTKPFEDVEAEELSDIIGKLKISSESDSE